MWRNLLRISVVFAVLLSVVACAAPAAAPAAPAQEAAPAEAGAAETGAAEAMSCEGQTVVVTTQTGPSISGPIEEHAAEWEAMTGGSVQIQPFAFGELFEKIVTSFETGANDYDMIVFPADWAGDFMAPGYLEPIPEDVLASLEPDDIIPLYRDRITAWGDTVYAMPYDGDAHMLYYRKDLVNPESPYAAEFQETYGYPLDEPQTWEQYYDIAEFFNDREVETAGQMAPIAGVAEAQRRNAQSYWVFLSHAASYGKVPDNACFFFDCADMTPQVNNPGWVAALDDYIRSRDLGPAEQLQWDVAQTRITFPAGAAVLNIDWGDVGPISYDPNTSVIAGNTGFGVLPAATRYYDYTQDAWVEEENQAPFIAFGGWIIGVAADSDAKACAMDFAKFMASPEMVKVLAVTPNSGINPSRYSQFEDVQMWVDAGFDEAGAQDYLDAVQNTINHPNAVLDLRIRGSAEYLNVLDVEVSRALAGEISSQEALDNVAAGWNEITDRLGREEQLQQYKDSVGFTE
jgi:multiple sugar transport system substrate-binding protein